MGDQRLIPEDVYWREVPAGRAAFLIDGEAYFAAFRSALLEARERVYILAWDLHSEVELVRGEGEAEDGFPRELGAFLHALLEARPELHIHVLAWDFSVIYSAEREWTVFSKWFSDPHPRLHLEQDGELPLGASHHQKVVVVDDSLAFAGGLDLSVWRWDDTDHAIDDPRRSDPKGEPYEPYHDVQMAVTGDAARALGDLCAERWERATGEALPRAEQGAETPWPAGVDADVENVDVGIALTFSEYEPHPAVFQVEKLHLSVISNARRYLYLENQYFSSSELVEAIEERLREPEGPEVILVLTLDVHGWLEEGTMGLLRDRLLERLRAADLHGRLRVYYPQTVEGSQKSEIFVHAKVIVADDRLVKIGSSNLSNRSMRMDSEVDLVVEVDAGGGDARAFLCRLLSVYFKRDTEGIEKHLAAHADLRSAIDALVDPSSSSLAPFPSKELSDIQRKLADTELLDPPVPIDPENWIRRVVEPSRRSKVLRRITAISALVIAGLLLAALVKWGWGTVVDKTAVEELVSSVEASPWTPALLLGLFVVVGLTGLPINVFLVTAAVVIGPWVALYCGFFGSHLSALVAFWVGRRVGQPAVEKLAPDSVQGLGKKLSASGFVSVMLVRIVPIAPFVVINLVAGASHLRFSVFNLGTILGMLPGMVAVVLLAGQVRAVVRDPGWGNVGLLVLVAALLVGGLYALRRSLRSRS